MLAWHLHANLENVQLPPHIKHQMIQQQYPHACLASKKASLVLLPRSGAGSKKAPSAAMLCQASGDWLSPERSCWPGRAGLIRSSAMLLASGRNMFWM